MFLLDLESFERTPEMVSISSLDRCGKEEEREQRERERMGNTSEADRCGSRLFRCHQSRIQDSMQWGLLFNTLHTIISFLHFVLLSKIKTEKLKEQK